MDVEHLITMEDWQGNMDHNLKGLEHVSTGACPGCQECGAECPECGHDLTESHGVGHECPSCGVEMELSEDGGFSWHACDCCGSPLGGDRYPAHGVGADGNIIHLDVCVDCVMYLANGDIPDHVIDGEYLPAPVPWSVIREQSSGCVFLALSKEPDNDPELFQVSHERKGHVYVRDSHGNAMDGDMWFDVDTPCQIVTPDYVIERMIACDC